jgi:uncharacterized protein (TIGR03437 family)
VGLAQAPQASPERIGKPEMPVSPDPQLSAFDDLMHNLLAKWRIPGAAIGVSHNGRLVLARAYGMADVAVSQPVQPDSLFRIGAISKALTAAAILRLVEDGKLSLETVREPLQTGMEQPAPANCGDAPGDVPKPPSGPAANPRETGSDAYCALGRMIEKASGQSYESYVQSAVLTPLGIARMQIGRTAPDERAKDEVRYYDFPGAPFAGPNIPRPYEATDLRSIEASGGWIASVFDLLRFANGLDGRRPTALLKPASVQAMLARPATVAAGAPSYSGRGWVVHPLGADADWWNFGGLPGSGAYLLRQAATGVDVAVLFNSRPADGDAFDAEVSAGVKRAVIAVAQWPSTDLFANGPELFARDVENSADHSVGRVAPGEIIILYPSNAGPPELAGTQLNGDGRVATVTGETRVLFDGIAAPMASSVRGRIGAVVPYEIAGRKTTQVVVEYRGVRSPPVTLAVVDTAPALYTLDGTGKGQAAMLNETGCCNSARDPAARGNIVTLFATGEGQTTPRGVDGAIARYSRNADLPKPRLPIAVMVGGVPAEIAYAGEAADSVAGSLQVNFRVPARAPLGDTVPLVLTVGGSRSPDGVTMAVRSEIQRVLVLDGDAALRNRLTGILKGAGYEVFPARDGTEALAQAGRHPLDMVISSLAMPEADRLETIRAIAAERRQLKIIVTATALDPTALRAADLLGAQAILTKPVAAERLLRRVRELLRVHPVPYVTNEKAAASPLRLPGRVIAR